MALESLRMARIAEMCPMIQQCITLLSTSPAAVETRDVVEGATSNRAQLQLELRPLISKIQNGLCVIQSLEIRDVVHRRLIDFASVAFSRFLHDDIPPCDANIVTTPGNPHLPSSRAAGNSKRERCADDPDNSTVRSSNRDSVDADSLLPLIEPGDISVSWDDILGAKEAVFSLKQAVVLPIQFPHLFSGARRPWSCILLYGPPGTGKTMLASAAAAEAKIPMFSISASDLLSKWVGDTEKTIRNLFKEASSKERCIIFLDEIDALCSSRGSGGESEGSRRIKTEFLVRMQTIDKRRVTIIAATNLPWELDIAFRRRFDRLIYVGLPELDDRRALVERKLRDVEHELNLDEVLEVSALLDGCTPCDVTNVSQHAIMRPLEALQSASYFCRKSTVDGEYFMPCSPMTENEGAFPAALYDLPSTMVVPRPVSFDDFVESLKRFPKSVTAAYISQYRNWEESLQRGGG